MKGKLFKKALAVATSVLMLAGGASVQPFIDIFEDMAITASAADTITVTFNTAGGTPVPETQTVESGGRITKPDQDPVKDGCTFEGWYIRKHKVEQVDDTIDIYTYFEKLDFDTDTITSDTFVCAKWSRPAKTVSFMDADGSTKTVEAVPLDGKERLIGDGWYVVDQDINYTNTLDISGDVHIILSDNHTMKFGSEGEWFANESIYTSSRGALSFYVQSEGENAGELCIEKKSDDNTGLGVSAAFVSELNIYGGKYNLTQGINAGDINITSGTFKCTNTDCAIVATNKLNISGGDLYIRTSRYGINSPDINISGGNFDIKSDNHGIYSDNKKKGTPVTITGGTIKNPGNGSENAGLFATGDIKILGGQYDDLGKEMGLYARGIIYFGYENIDDYIKISSWGGYVFSFNAGLPGATDPIILLKPFVLEGSDTAANVSYYNNNIKNNKIVPKTQTVTVTAKDTENNNVASSAAGSHTVVYGGTLTLTAPDVDGYIFRGWYEGDTLLTSESECTTNEITEDTAITALYETVSANTASAVFGTPVNGLYTLESKTYELNEDIYTVGRIYVPKGVKAVIDLNGHTIDRGLGSYKDGGGVIGVADGASLVVSNGTIKGGRRGNGNGGGFNVNGDLILNSVVIENCKAEHAGGGIYINGLNGYTASVTMRNNSIVRNNTAGTYGGGIYVGENAKLTIEGKPVVKDNTKSNVYLTEGRKINFMGALDPDTEIGITYVDEGKSGFTSEYSSYFNTADPSEYFFGDNGDEVVLNSGEARLAKEYIKRSWNSTTNKVEEETLYADTFISFSDVKVSGDNTVDLTENQWYVLTEDTLLSHKVRVFEGANILLCDGKELTCKSGIVVENGNTLNIYGQAKDSGKLISNGGEECAGIGADDDNSKDTAGTIRIFGGTISATSEKHGAGIGGGNETGGGTIEIYGGTVTAKGGTRGAGIGGGYDSEEVGNILIMGGRVTASSSEKGAGIGCSYLPVQHPSFHNRIAEGSVTISGGYVKVFAGAGSAGIGTSTRTDANMDITITGGTVIVESEESSEAGIGTGIHSDFTGTISITGGTVIANGGKQSPGIGAATNGDMEGSISITGGDVTAVGKSGAAAIGAGVREGWEGGHCTGTISITGGTVRLKNEDSEETPAVYIGRGYGYDGDEEGTLNIGSDMKVQLRNADDTAGEDVSAADRITACRKEHTDNRFLYIMPAETFIVNITAPTNGSITAKIGDTSASTAHYGDTITLDVTPDTGYSVKRVKVGNTVIEPVEGVYSFTMPAEDTTVTAEFEAMNIINSANITLGGELGLNFYVTVPDDVVAAGAKVVMDGPEGEKEVVLSSLTKDDKGRYKVTYKLKAIFVDRKVSLKVVGADDTVLDLYKTSGDAVDNGILEYGIYDYVELSKTCANLTDADKKTIKAMYTYGAYSVQWKYGTPLPDDVDALPEITKEQFEKYALKQSGTNSSITLTGASLVLDSNTAFRLYFNCAGDISGHSVVLGENTLNVQTTDTAGKYYVDIENIGAGNLRTDYTVTFDDTYSVTVSAMTYVYNYLKSGMNDEKLCNLLKALYAYSEAVNPSNES